MFRFDEGLCKCLRQGRFETAADPPYRDRLRAEEREEHVQLKNMYILRLSKLAESAFKFFDYVSTNQPVPLCLLPTTLKAHCGNLLMII
jgi:hypothetical protein